MANQEHLDILKQGVEIWDKWRKKHPNIRPDLSDANHIGPSREDLRYEAPFMVSIDWRNDLGGPILVGIDFSKADLVGTNLCEADLSLANLSGADLHRAYLNNTLLEEADLSDADLSDADLSGAMLNKANLTRAKLRGADLRGADLRGADLSQAEISATLFVDVNLSTVRGLETVRHKGPSSIGIDTIYHSEGNIPEVFLKGVGVDDTFITYIRSLVGKPIEYYSCFISYSSIDEAFAKRLYADLQSKNVRCWFAPEDMKIGDRIRPHIDEAIRIHDKLLLILSENSVESTWVEKEVETALEKERKQQKLVLFPIRLDDCVMNTDQAWAADIRRTRHIGDFRGWKRSHDKYQKAFERLLRDLKAGG